MKVDVSRKSRHSLGSTAFLRTNNGANYVQTTSSACCQMSGRNLSHISKSMWGFMILTRKCFASFSLRTLSNLRCGVGWIAATPRCDCWRKTHYDTIGDACRSSPTWRTVCATQRDPLHKAFFTKSPGYTVFALQNINQSLRMRWGSPGAAAKPWKLQKTLSALRDPRIT